VLNDRERWRELGGHAADEQNLTKLKPLTLQIFSLLEAIERPLASKIAGTPGEERYIDTKRALDDYAKP
jgi:hypothetical protein